jgi:hypothetical protein
MSDAIKQLHEAFTKALVLVHFATSRPFLFKNKPYWWYYCPKNIPAVGIQPVAV